jgi:hypothetical protein
MQFISIFIVLYLFNHIEISNSIDSIDKNARFLWLTQTERYLPALFKHIRSRNDSDVIALSWKRHFRNDDPEE